MGYVPKDGWRSLLQCHESLEDDSVTETELWLFKAWFAPGVGSRIWYVFMAKMKLAAWDLGVYPKIYNSYSTSMRWSDNDYTITPLELNITPLQKGKGPKGSSFSNPIFPVPRWFRSTKELELYRKDFHRCGSWVGWQTSTNLCLSSSHGRHLCTNFPLFHMHPPKTTEDNSGFVADLGKSCFARSQERIPKNNYW